MLIFAGDEEKRSRLYHIVLATSTVLLLLVIVYVLMRIFTGNPLTGKWASQESDLVLDIKESGKAKITVDISEDETEVVELTYTADLDEKTITFMNAETELLKEKAEIADATEEDAENYIWAEVSPYISTFSFSIENNELILSDMEYGEQMVLDKSK